MKWGFSCCLRDELNLSGRYIALSGSPSARAQASITQSLWVSPPAYCFSSDDAGGLHYCKIPKEEKEREKKGRPGFVERLPQQPTATPFLVHITRLLGTMVYVAHTDKAAFQMFVLFVCLALVFFSSWRLNRIRSQLYFCCHMLPSSKQRRLSRQVTIKSPLWFIIIIIIITHMEALYMMASLTRPLCRV